jgi:hypothetical protein
MSGILLWAAVGLGGVVAAAGAGALLFLLAFLPLTLRSMRLLPAPRRTTVDGVTGIDDAVRACRASGLSGLELVAFAQRLAARKFSYSRRNPWDGWARAFERGMGYCIQQAMALKMVYDALGVDARPVQAFRVWVPPGRVHGVLEPACVSGHMWLRVRVDGRGYDVCPGSETNRPGVTHFKLLSRVMGVPRALVPVLQVLCAAENVRRDWRSPMAGAAP